MNHNLQCQIIRTEKEGIYVKQRQYKMAVDIKLTFILELKLQKEHFFAKYNQFFS